MDQMSMFIQEIPVINRGFLRAGIPQVKRDDAPISSLENINHEPDVAQVWNHLQWWESPLQARAGIEWLLSEPFLRLTGPPGKDGLFPTRALYPYALRRDQPERLQMAAETVAASVRQAREMYLAAATAGVTDLGRPLLYFYGAHALAKAAVAVLLGVDDEAMNGKHGLKVEPGPSARHENLPWPTVIRWKATGLFAMLYRVTRWDQLYACCYDDSAWKGSSQPRSGLQFHVLECIRFLQYNWGLLPVTGFAPPWHAMHPHQWSQFLLLPYRDPGDMFTTRETPLDTPRIEAPRVLVMYMLLYYFSILARYNPTAWQKLLAADQEPEGYVFRSAMERTAQDFLHEVIRLLPLVRPSSTFAPETWSDARPVLSDWYRAPGEVVTTRLEGSGHSITMYQLEEWTGTPTDACAKAQNAASLSATSGQIKKP